MLLCEAPQKSLNHSFPHLAMTITIIVTVWLTAAVTNTSIILQLPCTGNWSYRFLSYRKSSSYCKLDNTPDCTYTHLVSLYFSSFFYKAKDFLQISSGGRFTKLPCCHTLACVICLSRSMHTKQTHMNNAIACDSQVNKVAFLWYKYLKWFNNFF
jgi:hypothetical protein